MTEREEVNELTDEGVSERAERDAAIAPTADGRW